MNSRPPYLRYLLWWCVVWMLITIPAQQPEWYETSKVLAPYDHKSVGSEFFRNLLISCLIDATFGPIWGSLSWLLQRGASRWSFSLMKAAGQVATLEAIVLGVPLSLLYIKTVNLPIGFLDDLPTITISNNAIAVNVAGVLLAFPLACLFAAYRSAPRKSAPASVKETEAAAYKDDLAVWPPPPQTGPSDEG